MSTYFNGPTWSFMTPEDTNVGETVAQFVSLVPSTSTLRTLIYEWTDPAVYLVHTEAQKRGVESKAWLDHLQTSTPHESANLGAFFGSINRWSKDGTILYGIGTSWVGDQIIHAKCMWANWTETSLPPQVERPVYDNWQSYVSAGYPTVLRGSFNFSTSANRQVNCLDISPSWELCDMYQKTFNKISDYNMKKNVGWNEPNSTIVPILKTGLAPDE